MNQYNSVNVKAHEIILKTYVSKISLKCFDTALRLATALSEADTRIL